MFQDPEDDEDEDFDAEDIDEDACTGCGKRIFSLVLFCGFCGFCNHAFDEVGFVTKTNISIQEARTLYCTPHWHGQLVSDWKNAPEHMREEALFLRYCCRCGEELISDHRANDLQIDALIKEAFD